MTVDLAALAKLAAELTEGCQPGPWHGVPGGQGSWWLDNAAGDSSFPDSDDVAAMLNALPALVRVALAAKAAAPVAWVSYDGDSWFASNAGIEDAEERLTELSAALAELDR